MQAVLPDFENHSNWNVTVEGLLILFDEYHVSPYAADP